jgi:hypothetical protein
VVDIGRTLANGKVKVTDRIEHAEICPLFEREQPKHLKRKAWRKQEKRANALVGARDTVASGSIGEDGDGRLFHQWRVESKGTEKEHFLLRQDVWTKLVKGALLAGEEPVLNLKFSAELYSYVVIRKELFDAVLAGTLTLWATDKFKNKKSYRINRNVPLPHLIDLEPPGVLISEAELKKLKETF